MNLFFGLDMVNSAGSLELNGLFGGVKGFELR